MASVKYIHLLEAVKNSIENGEYKPGDLIPSEKQLGEAFELSRMSVRKALTLLVEREYLKSIPGKGYFVNRPDSNRFTLVFSEEEFAKRHRADIKLDHIEIVQPDKEIFNRLNISRNKKVVLIKQVYLDEGQPIAYGLKYYPYVKGSAFVESEIDYATHPVKAIQNQPAFSFQKELTIRTEISNYEDYKSLRLEEPAPIMVVEQLYIDRDGNPAMWGVLRVVGAYGLLEGHLVK